MTDDEVVAKARDEGWQAVAYGWAIPKDGRKHETNVGQLRRLERAGRVHVDTVTVASWKNTPQGQHVFYLVRAT